VGRIWAAAFLMRRLRSERGVLLLLVLLVAGTSLIVSAAPRLYNSVADAGLRSVLAETSVPRRNIALTRDVFAAPGELAPDAVQEQGAELTGQFDPAIQSVISAREVLVASPRFHVDPSPKYRTFVTLRAQSGLDSATKLVAGRWPARVSQSPTPDSPPQIEIAISRTTAEESGLAVGQVLTAGPDAADQLITTYGGAEAVAQFPIVGEFEIKDPSADIWWADNRLEHVGLAFTINDAQAFATALIAPDAAPDIAALNVGVHIEWRSFLDPSRMDVGALDALLPALQRLDSEYARASLRATDAVLLRTDLTRVLLGFGAQRSASDAVLTVAAIGPLALAGAAIGMLAILLGARRRASTALARARGASTGVLLLSQTWEGVVFIGAAALAGYGLATALVPGRPSPLSAILSAAIAVGGIAIFVASVVPGLRRPMELAARDVTPPVRVAPRRFVIEATAVGLAVAGIVLLQQRGLAITPGGRSAVRVDPFLAAVPVLAGAAAGIVTTRLYPIPVRFLGWLAARLRGIVPVLALRHVVRRPSFAALPILVLLATAAFSSFALLVMTSLDRGQVEASWRAVGADYRITAGEGRTLKDLDPMSVPGTEAVASAYDRPSAQMRLELGRVVRVDFVAIDAAAYAAVVAGTPVQPSWPAELLDQRLAAGTPEDPIPAVLSSGLPAGVEPIPVGQRVKVRLGDTFWSFRIVAIRPEFPGVVEGPPFLITPIQAVRPLSTQVTSNITWVRGSAAAGPELAALIDRAGPPSTALLSRDAWYVQLKGEPLIQVIADTFRVAFALAAIYAAISVVIALTLTAARRSEDLAFLRTLGLSGRQSAGLVIVEHGVPILLSLVPGLLTGVAVALLLEPTLGLDAFLGGTARYRVVLDWSGVAAVAGLLVAVVVVAIAVSTWLARRVSMAEALRVGEA
jgi:putative ABC transport system permease protein